MPKKKSDLSQYPRRSRKIKRLRAWRSQKSCEDREAKLAARRERQRLIRLLNGIHAKPEPINHFTPDQFESNRVDGLVKLKPNAASTIFYHHKPAVECKVPVERRKVLKRTEQFIINGEVKTIERTYPELKSDAVPSIFPKDTTNNRPEKRRRTSRKSCICCDSVEVVNGLNIAKNSIEGTKKKLCLHRQKSQCAVKRGKTAETLQLDMKQKQIFASSITNVLEVDLSQHMCSVNVKQEPQDFENEEVDGFVNEEFLEDRLATTACHVIIKEEADLELGVDVENTVVEGPFQTSVCTDNIKEEPESTVEATGMERNVNKFTEVFVPEWCPSSIKKEEVCDNVMLEPQILPFTQ